MVGSCKKLEGCDVMSLLVLLFVWMQLASGQGIEGGRNLLVREVMIWHVGAQAAGRSVRDKESACVCTHILCTSLWKCYSYAQIYTAVAIIWVLLHAICTSCYCTAHTYQAWPASGGGASLHSTTNLSGFIYPSPLPPCFVLQMLLLNHTTPPFNNYHLPFQ